MCKREICSQCTALTISAAHKVHKTLTRAATLAGKTHTARNLPQPSQARSTKWLRLLAQKFGDLRCPGGEFPKCQAQASVLPSMSHSALCIKCSDHGKSWKKIHFCSRAVGKDQGNGEGCAAHPGSQCLKHPAASCSLVSRLTTIPAKVVGKERWNFHVFSGKKWI